MTLKSALRSAVLISMLAACSDTSDTVDYTVHVTGIEVVQKGGDERLEVDGLPSASGSLVQPNPGRYSAR